MENYEIVVAIAILIVAGVTIAAVSMQSMLSVSPYCKALPVNAVNVVSLADDAAGCPHWYIEIRSVLKNCFCLVGGYTSCEGDEDYASIWEGCRGALPPGCPTCPIYGYTPIADYGGLLEGFECAKDIIQICPDNSKIITKACVDGLYSPTNNTCINGGGGEEPQNYTIIIILVIVFIITIASFIYLKYKHKRN